MRRWVGIVAVVVGTVVATLQVTPEIEERLTDVEDRVTALETRVAIAPMGTIVPSSGVEQDRDTITITGSGDTVSDSFPLSEGSFLVQVRHEVEERYIGILTIRPAPESSGVTSSSLLSGVGDPVYMGEHMVDIQEPGEFVIVSRGPGIFTVIIEL